MNKANQQRRSKCFQLIGLLILVCSSLIYNIKAARRISTTAADAANTADADATATITANNVSMVPPAATTMINQTSIEKLSTYRLSNSVGENQSSFGLMQQTTLYSSPINSKINVTEHIRNDTATPPNSSNSSLPSTSAVSEEDTSNSQHARRCPAVILDALGIYDNTTSLEQRRPFENTVLITAVDSLFFDLYQNWRLLLQQYSIKHVAVAMDESSFKRLDSTVALRFSIDLNGTSAERTATTEERIGRSVHLRLVCSKLKIKFHILQQCGPFVNVVFSDVDVAFVRDPFQHDLGRFISAGFDFVYSTEYPWSPQPAHRDNNCLVKGAFGEGVFNEGNTGLEYLGNRRWLLDLLAASHTRCVDPSNTYHDQFLFWRFLRRKLYLTKRRWYHCNTTRITARHQLGDDDVGAAIAEEAAAIPPKRRPWWATLCCLDPHFYPSGGRPVGLPQATNASSTNSSTVVTFHANLAGKKIEKVQKLKTFVEGGWKLSSPPSFAPRR